MSRVQSSGQRARRRARNRVGHLVRGVSASALGAASLLGCASAGMGRSAGSPGTRAELRYAIDSMVASPKFSNAHWGILIVDPERGDTLYSRNAGKLFMPASNQKIVTGAVALTLLGPDYQFSTAFAARGARRRRRASRRSRRDRTRRSVDERPHARRCHAGAPRCSRFAARARRSLCVGPTAVAAGDAFPDAWHGFGWGWDDFDAAYSAGVDELFFNEGMFQHHAARRTARRCARVDAPCVRTSDTRRCARS